NVQRRSVFIHIIIICFCLPGLDVGSTSTSNIYGPLDITLWGPDMVTVAIPASFFCFSQCSPACLYSITADGRSADTDEITIIIRERLNITTVTCTAKNNITGHTSTTHKTLQVLQGPENVSISGPAYLPVDRSQRFLCSAVCWPSCNYSWTSNGLPRSTSGNQLVVTPSAAVAIETLVCKATNSKSGIFASAVRKLFVTDGPLYTIIRGPDRIQLHSSTMFECLSRCKPSCNYTWTAENQTHHSKIIDVSVESWRESLTLTCTATNIITNSTEVTQKTLSVTENTAAPLRMNLMSAFVIALSLHFT
ncbi:hypothetical protein IRJ41_020252, partial [Triplophysa rosa]